MAARKRTPNTKQMLQVAKPKKAAAAPPPDNGLPQGEELDKYIQEMADWAAVYGGGHPSNSPFPNLGNKVKPRLTREQQLLNLLFGDTSQKLMRQAGDSYNKAMEAPFAIPQTGGYGAYGNMGFGTGARGLMDVVGTGTEGLLRSNIGQFFGGEQIANLAGLRKGNPNYKPTVGNTLSNAAWLALSLAPSGGGGAKRRLAGKGLGFAKQINPAAALWGLLTE